MNRWILPAAWCSCLTLALVATPAIAARPRAAAPAASGAARVETLKNGLRLLLAPDARAAAVDVAIWYDAGPRDEKPGATGITHLVERLMFDGSEHVAPGEHRRQIESEGGVVGSYTSADYACFYETVAPGSLEMALRLEADRMAGLKAGPANLDDERRRIQGEKRDRLDASPVARGQQRLYATAFPQLAYRWPVYGVGADLQRLTLADCLEYHRARFGPSSATVTLVGRFDPDEALALARKYFEPLPRRGGGETKVAREAAKGGERRAVEPGGPDYSRLAVGWSGPPASDPDLSALTLMTIMLTSGDDSRLQREFVTGQQTCVRVDGGCEPHRDGSLVYAMLGLGPQADSAQVERDLVEQFEKFTHDAVRDDELEAAKREAEAALWFAALSPHGQAQALGAATLTGDASPSTAERVERLRAVTAADLQRVAAKTFVAARRAVVWMPRVSPGAGDSDAGGGGGRGGQP